MLIVKLADAVKKRRWKMNVCLNQCQELLNHLLCMQHWEA
jgi:hypothetical protein